MILYLEALAAIALSLSLLMAGAWMVRERTGNSGWVDTIWTFALGLVGGGSAQWPVAGSPPNARQWLVAALVAIWSLRLGLHIAVRTSGITDDPRYASFAREWGVDSSRKMFVFLQNQGLGSIPLVFAIFVAAHFTYHLLRPQDYLAALILIVAIAGEALADAQLKRSGSSPRTRAGYATSACGDGRAIRIISSNGWAGSLTPSSRSRRTTSFLSLGLGELAGARLHVLDPGAFHRHPAARRADVAFAGRALPYQSRTSLFFPLPPRRNVAT
jgi:hypothetical protein